MNYTNEEDSPEPCTEYIVCANSKCAFEMKESDLVRGRADEYVTKLVCPVCSHDKWEFTGKKIDPSEQKESFGNLNNIPRR